MHPFHTRWLVSLSGALLLAATPAAAQQPAAKVGDRVLVKFYSITDEASVVAARRDSVRVHYLEKDVPDAWVGADQLVAYEPGDTRGGPPLGRYQCYMPVRENSYMGAFALRPGGVYQYLTGTRGAGRYRFTPATRAVAFTGGPLAGKVVEAEYVNTRQDGPMLRLVFPKGRRAGDVQNCLHRS